jgi:uncharacterized protein (DUF302 family)
MVGHAAPASIRAVRPLVADAERRHDDQRRERKEINMVFEETVVLDMAFDEALTATRSALADHGFGVLTEIDVQQTLKSKIDKDMDRYVILGACNPKLASAALDVEPNVGVLLPCNVVVREVDGKVQVDALDPGLMVSMTSVDELAPIAAEARRLIGDALAALAA